MTTPLAFSSVNFRAPPPSPVASAQHSPLPNDDIFADYLHQSLIVPDLVLPDRVFSHQKSTTQTPPILDLEKLDTIQNASTHELIPQKLGCIEVINHGISPDLIKFVLELGGGLFEMSLEQKRALTRSTERRYGFEEIHEEEEISCRRNESEVFVWCESSAMRGLEMERICPPSYSNFSEKMEELSGKIKQIGGKILKFLQSISLKDFDLEDSMRMDGEIAGNLCYIHKHTGSVESEKSLRCDLIRMLIRRSEHPHALSLHICNGSTEFHVYSNKGWVSFYPTYQDSILLTVGDLVQARMGGKYKHVIGRAIFRNEDEKNVSMAFLYSPPKITNSIIEGNDITISVTQQIKLVVFFVFVCNFTSYIHNIMGNALQG